MNCWEPTTLILHTADKFRNPCTTGGLAVAASLVVSGSKHTRPAEVVDRSDGTYAITFSLDRAGAWSLQVRQQRLWEAGALRATNYRTAPLASASSASSLVSLWPSGQTPADPRLKAHVTFLVRLTGARVGWRVAASRLPLTT